MSALPGFAVVTVNFASAALLEANAAALDLPQEGRLVIVDCFSSAEERRRVEEAARRLGADFVPLDENRGYGGGTNAGAAHALAAGAEVLVPLNPDARIAREDLERLVREAAGTDALVSPRIRTSTGRSWFDGADLYLDDGTTAGARARAVNAGRPSRPWATGACFAIGAELWRRVGGFDEEYFLYWEDIDLSHRVLDAGGELRMSDAEVVHDEGGTHDEERRGRAKSSTYYYFNIRNRLLYARKHLDAATGARWRRSAVRVGYGVLLQGGRRQLVTSAAPWRALLRGVRDGRRLLRTPPPTRKAPA